MSYSKNIISLEEKRNLARKYSGRVIYEVKSDIDGCCIKLFTDEKPVKERWEENFYPISYNIRPHGYLYVVKDPEKPTLL